MKKTNFLALFFKQKRIDIGLTQRDLARALFVSDKTISKWERGESLPSLAQIGDILNVLHIDFHEFVDLIRPSSFEANENQIIVPPMATEVIKKLKETNIETRFQLSELNLEFWSSLPALQKRQIERYIAQLIQQKKLVGIDVKVENDPPPYTYQKKVLIKTKTE